MELQRVLSTVRNMKRAVNVEMKACAVVMEGLLGEVTFKQKLD